MTTTVQDLAWAARVVRDAVKDRSYRATPLGLEVARYYRWKKNGWGATAETMRDYERTLAWLAIDHADLQVKDFEPPMGTRRLEDWIEHRWGDTSPKTSRAAAGQRAPRTIAKNVSILRDFFRWAVRNELLYGNPALDLARPRKRDTEQDVFAPQTISQIIDAEPRLRDRVALRLVTGLGLRKGGLRVFQLKHYDQHRHRATIHTKGGRIQRLPVEDPWLRAELEEYILERLAAGGSLEEFLLYPEKIGPKHNPDRPPLEVLWCDRSKPMAATTLHRWWHKRLAQAGVPAARMHQARHTTITDFLRLSGGNYPLAQLLAGHSSIQTTVDTYGHLDVDDLAEALRIIAEKRADQ